MGTVLEVLHAMGNISQGINNIPTGKECFVMLFRNKMAYLNV